MSRSGPTQVSSEPKHWLRVSGHDTMGALEEPSARTKFRVLRHKRKSKVSVQPKIEIYTWATCPYCVRAKALLNSKGVPFQEYSVDGDEVAREAMARRASGRRSLPQIFINDHHIGGCDDLHALDARGKLDGLLRAE